MQISLHRPLSIELWLKVRSLCFAAYDPRIVDVFVFISFSNRFILLFVFDYNNLFSSPITGKCFHELYANLWCRKMFNSNLSQVESWIKSHIWFAAKTYNTPLLLQPQLLPSNRNIIKYSPLNSRKAKKDKAIIERKKNSIQMAPIKFYFWDKCPVFTST